MTPDEITTTLRAFARSRKSGCRACPEYNSCGKYEQLKYWGEYAGIVDDVTHWMEVPEEGKNGRS